jgi:SPP1 family phage portal protein
LFGKSKNKHRLLNPFSTPDDVGITSTEVGKNISDKQFIEMELLRWKQSRERNEMLEGERYYNGEHDILKRKRTVIGKDGKLQEVDNLPNNRIVDNQYKKMVDQKVNFLVGKPITFDTENEAYSDALDTVFNKRFHRTLKNICENSFNCGKGWLYPYLDEVGELRCMRFEPFEIKPFWKDAEHTILDFGARLYQVEVYEGTTYTIKEKVELYYPDRIERYDFDDGILIPDNDSPTSDYIVFEDENGVNTAYNWGRVPLIPFKRNNREIPLIRNVKTLQDGINMMLSDFENNMQEDSRNTILIIKNYDGQNLAEFRHNLATFGAVKVKTIDGSEGGVDALQVEVNAENYKAILEVFKKAIIENAMAYDAKDDRMNGTPNQMNIQSMYSDIDLDANNMETEFQASFEELLEFVNMYFINKGMGDFRNEKVDVIFNRNMMFNETESIDNCVKSVGLLSDETIVAQHPWVTDVKGELERKKEEKQENLDEYANAFTPISTASDEGGEGDEE